MRTFTLSQTAAFVAGACLVVLLLPTSVEAAGSALTRITDGSGPVARIDQRGKLAVGDGAGRLTVDGRVGVSSLPPVSGTVTTRPGPATRPWMNVNGTTLNAANPARILYAGVANQKLNLTTFSASVPSGNAGSVTIHAQVLVGDPTANCDNIGGGGFGAAERFTIVVPVGETVVETFPSPLTWTAYGQGADKFCVQLTGSGPTGWSAYVLANGFLG